MNQPEIDNFIDSLANWLEVFGFIITIITAIKVFIIDKRVLVYNKRHLFQVRIKEHISDLKDISKKISNLILDFDNNKRELKTELKRSEEVAKSIERKLLKRDLVDTKALIREAIRIEKLPDDINNLSFFSKCYSKLFALDEFNEEVMNKYYIQLSGLITSLEELKKDTSKSLSI